MLALPFMVSKLFELTGNPLLIAGSNTVISLICPDYLFLNLLFKDLSVSNFVTITVISSSISLVIFWVFFLSQEKLQLFKASKIHMIKKSKMMKNDVRIQYRDELEDGGVSPLRTFNRMDSNLQHTLEIDFTFSHEEVANETQNNKKLEQIVLLNLSFFSSFKVNFDDLSVFVMRKQFVVSSMLDDCVEMDLRKFPFYENSTVNVANIKWFVEACRIFFSKGRTKIFLAKFEKINVIEQFILVEVVRLLSSDNPQVRFFLFAREIDSLFFDCQVIEVYRKLVRYKSVFKLPAETNTEKALAANLSLVAKKPDLLVQEIYIYSRREIYEKMLKTLEDIDFKCESSATFSMN